MPDQPRPTRTVLSAALREIQDRRARLIAAQQKLNQEKVAAEDAIIALRQLIAACPTPTPTPQRTNVQVATTSPTPMFDDGPLKPGELTRRIITVLDSSIDPLTREQIATLVGHNGRGLGMALNKAIKAERLVLVDGAYGLSSKTGD